MVSSEPTVSGQGAILEAAEGVYPSADQETPVLTGYTLRF